MTTAVAASSACCCGEPVIPCITCGSNYITPPSTVAVSAQVFFPNATIFDGSNFVNVPGEWVFFTNVAARVIPMPGLFPQRCFWLGPYSSSSVAVNVYGGIGPYSAWTFGMLPTVNSIGQTYTDPFTCSAAIYRLNDGVLVGTYSSVRVPPCSLPLSVYGSYASSNMNASVS